MSSDPAQPAERATDGDETAAVPARTLTLQVRGCPLVQLEDDRRFFVIRKLAKEGLAAFEPETSAVLLAAASHLGPDEWFFDVGANIGIYTVLIETLLPSVRTVGFEPSPELAEATRRNVELNGGRAEVEGLALGRETGTATLYLSATTDSSNSLLEGFRRAEDTVEVPVERLDDYVERTGRVPGLLKVDTEATEPDVLDGATRLLLERRPLIVCEVLHGRTEDRLNEIIRRTGYRAFHLRDELPPEEAEALVGDDTYRYFNYLLAPHEPPISLWVEAAVWRERLRPRVATATG